MNETEKISVLCVDDIEANLTALEIVLSDVEADLVMVRSGIEALRELEKREFAVILLDVMMPVMDGFETAKRIREKEESKYTPIIFVTAYPIDERQVFRGYAFGAVDYINKPISPEILISKVRVFVKLFKQREQLKEQALRETQIRWETQRLRAELERETALRESEAKFRVFAENASDVILTINEKSQIVFVNRSMEKVFGYLPEELIGEPLTILMPELLRERHRLAIARFLQTGEKNISWEHVELPGLHKNGNEIALEISFGSFASGGQTLFFGIVRDITERKIAQEELKEVTDELKRSNEELERFTAVASHDLQEPLRTISTHLQILERRVSEKLDRQSLEYMRFVVDGAERMKQLIHDLLSYSRVGNTEIPFEPIDLNVVLAKTVENLKIAIEETKAAIKWDHLPTVRGDGSQLIQLFQNIIENAIKYCRKDVALKIRVSVNQVNEEWLLCVRDNGIGFDMKYAKEVFETFHRLHTRSEYAGSGLGLATCKKIVERHHGRIWVESIAGQGSNFCLTLPLYNEPNNESLRHPMGSTG